MTEEGRLAYLASERGTAGSTAYDAQPQEQSASSPDAFSLDQTRISACIEFTCRVGAEKVDVFDVDLDIENIVPDSL